MSTSLKSKTEISKSSIDCCLTCCSLVSIISAPIKIKLSSMINLFYNKVTSMKKVSLINNYKSNNLL